jgi:TPR repeat protein
MFIRPCLIVVMFLFPSAAFVWADNQAVYVDSLKKRAAQGDANAQITLGFKYFLGGDVPQDYAESLKWFLLAANQGDANAQFNVGLTYCEGKGVPQDYIQAHKWLNLAAASTDPIRGMAVTWREDIAARMTPAQVAEAQKLAREWQKQ